MALDSIKVQYEADIEKFKQQLKSLEAQMTSLEAKTKKSAQAGEDAFKKEDGIINKLRANIEKLSQARDKSNNPNLIDAYNKKLDEANDRLKKLTNTQKDTEKSVSTFQATLSKMLPILGGVFAVDKIIAFGASVIDTTAKFQKFEAVLTNTLGSKGAALEALTMIKNFAASTPFQVDELTDSFVRLANQGFIATKDELRKLGDVAASTGKGFNQLTEAIIDAQTGEFERLKEFGIRASKEGDKVTFTFKGVQTQTQFTNKAIRDYILSLGDAQGVSGAMAAISKTVGGQLSNLEDTVTDLKNTIGQALAPVLSNIITGISNFISGLKEIKVLGFAFDSILAPARALFEVLKDTYDTAIRPIAEFLRALFVPILDTLNKAFGTSGISISNLLAKFNPLIIALKISLIPLQLLAKGLELLTPVVTKHIIPAFQDFIILLARARNGVAGFVDAITQSGVSKKIQDTLGFEIGKVGKVNIEELTKSFKEGTKQQIEDTRQLDKVRKETEERTMKGQHQLTEFEKAEIAERERARKKELLDFIKSKNKSLEIQKEMLGFNTPDKKLDLVENEKEKNKKLHEERLKGMKKFKSEVTDPIIESGKEATKKQEEIELQAEKDKQNRQKVALDTAIQATNMITDAIGQGEQRRTDEELAQSETRTDNELAALERKKEQGRITEEQFQKQKEVILASGKQREAAIKTKDAQNDKKLALFRIAIDTAAAIIKGIVQFGPPPSPPGIAAIASASALGLIEAGIVLATPIPKFAKGVTRFKGKGTNTSDSNLALLSNNESVINAKASIENEKAIDALNKGDFRKYIERNHVLPALRKASESKHREDMNFANNINNMYNLMKSKDGFYDGNIIRAIKKKDSYKIENVGELARAISKNNSEDRY